MKKEKLLREYLKLNRESPFSSDLKVDYSPLLWCDRARNEALQFFCEENHLIRVTVYARKDSDGLEPKTFLLPHEGIRVPIELLDDRMMATLKAGVTLHLQIGEGCGKSPIAKSNNVVYDQIFAYNKHTWAEYCQVLASNAFHIYKGVIITLRQSHRSNWRELVPDFLLELAHVRNAGDVWTVNVEGIKFFDALAFAMSEVPVSPEQWHNLLIGLIEESQVRVENESLDAGMTMLCRANNVAEVAVHHMAIQFPSDTCDRNLLPYVNGTFALCTKIFNLYIWGIHLAVGSRVRNGVYPASAIVAITRMYKAMSHARLWPGMGPKQLAGVMFVSGIFVCNVAGFLSHPFNMELAQNDPDFQIHFDVKGHLRDATHYFWLAAKIHPAKYEQIAMNEWEGLYKMYGNGEPKENFIPDMETLSTPTGGEWYGPVNMWNQWGRERLHYLVALQEVKISKLSKAQVKKSRERLSVGNCRKEGLLKCLLK